MGFLNNIFTMGLGTALDCAMDDIKLSVSGIGQNISLQTSSLAEASEELARDAGDLISDAASYAVENPWKTAAVISVGVATAGAGFIAATAAAPAIAATVGSTGILGATSTGTVISSLHGVALTNASLAAIGGGSVAAGGAGMAGGAAAIATTGACVGGGVGVISGTVINTTVS